MSSLSSKQQAFIKLMKNGEDYERRGFELLLQRSDFQTFFDALADEGLFDPSRNSGPVEADKLPRPLLAAASVSRSRRAPFRRRVRHCPRRKGNGGRPQRQPVAR